MLRLVTLLLLCTFRLAAQTSAPVSGRQQALALEQAHDLPGAKAAWQQVLANAPGNSSAGAEANAHLGLLDALTGNYADAVPAYQRALAIDPKMPGVQMDLGLALFKQTRLAEAIAPLHAAAEQNPSDLRARLLLGMAQYGTGHYAEAIPSLRDGLALTPDNLQLRLTLAQSCLWAKDYTCALEQNQLILKQDPNSAQADMIAGEALDAKGDSTGALAQFRAAEAAAPNTPDLHFGLGYLLWKQGQFSDAATEFSRELQLVPTHAQALTYRGDLAVKRNDWAAARTDLELASAQPNAVRLTWLDLGLVNAHDGKNAEAEMDFKRAIALAPADPDAHYRLARLSQTMGNNAQARAELAKVQQLHQAKDQVPDKSLVQQITPPRAP